MIPIVQIDDKLISVDIFEKKFSCDVDTCAGICCVLGDSGAPLEYEELEIVAEEYVNFASYLKPEGRDAVEEQGVQVVDSDGDHVTPLINGKECAYSYFDEQNVCRCAIERAFFEGKTTFRKPISCWLYPIRLKQLGDFVGMNYDQWHVCNCAREKGEREGIPVFRFLKEPIIRRFGKAFYEQLEEAAKQVSTPS